MITQTLIEMGKPLEFSVVAEGVENLAQLEILRHYRSGLFYFSIATDRLNEPITE